MKVEIEQDGNEFFVSPVDTLKSTENMRILDNMIIAVSQCHSLLEAKETLESQFQDVHVSIIS